MSLASMATSHVYEEHDKQKSPCRYGQQSTLTLSHTAVIENKRLVMRCPL